MIFNTCLTSDRAVLLRVSKHFHELGLRSLYHSIWITKIYALESLHRTLVDANAGYAKLIRVFEVIIVKSDQFPTFVSPDHTNSLQDILFQLKNVEKVQVYAPTLITKDFGMAKGIKCRFEIPTPSRTPFIVVYLPTDPWHGDFDLDFLSEASSLRRFSLSFVRVERSLPWDLAVIAEFLGNLNSGLFEVHIYGATYRRSSSTIEGEER
ncbi:hypothetical protein LENED_001036 [Lentinula edodes]|uniref:Uncharacterized protein n=1 Tax=Lentinula edodes TaxID=5353 RepID=A0A1Q3DX39_LENED|nr:hypothetical protein LENED_001036 [Lentinula edodes]